MSNIRLTRATLPTVTPVAHATPAQLAAVAAHPAVQAAAAQAAAAVVNSKVVPPQASTPLSAAAIKQVDYVSPGNQVSHALAPYIVAPAAPSIAKTLSPNISTGIPGLSKTLSPNLSNGVIPSTVVPAIQNYGTTGILPTPSYTSPSQPANAAIPNPEAQSADWFTPSEGGGASAAQTPSTGPDVNWGPSQDDDTAPLPPDVAVPMSTAIANASTVAGSSLWQRILAFFGIGKSASPTPTAHGENPTDRTSLVESFIRRARSGDQNAMAMLVLIRDNAAKGIPNARASYEIAQRYLAENPISPAAAMGAEAGYRSRHDPHVFANAVSLSQGPALTNSRLRNFVAKFSGESQAAIMHGFRHKANAGDRGSPVHVKTAIRMGKILGTARSIQAVRQPGSSISQYDSNVGWELGE